MKITEPNSGEIDLVLAAQRLCASYSVTHNLVLSGKLKGHRREGRWFVELTDLKRLIRERKP